MDRTLFSREIERKHTAALTPLFLERVPAFFASDVPSWRLAAFVSLIKPIVWHSGKHRNDLTDVLFRAMEHSNGSVREAARRAADWLRMDLTDGHDSESITRLANHLDRIEVLLRKYRPENTPTYIEELKPSPYKTLVLYWYDTTRGSVGEQVGREDRIKRNNIPTLRLENETWLDANMVDFHEEFEKIWHYPGAGTPAKAHDALVRLAQSAKKRLYEALERLGFDSRFTDRVISTIERCGDDEAQLILVDIVRQYLDKSQLHDIAEVAEAARAIQSFINHRPRINTHGEPVSHLLVDCLVIREMNERRVPTDWAAFAVLIDTAHTAIDAFIEKRTKEHDKAMKELDDRINRLTGGSTHWEHPEKLEEKRMEKLLAAEYVACAHYALDWYAQIAPWNVYKKAPEQLAALALRVVGEYNFEKQQFAPQYNTTELAAVGGWKSPSSISYPALSMLSDLVHNMRDPDMLLVNPRLAASLYGEHSFVGSPAGGKNGMFRYFAIISWAHSHKLTRDEHVRLTSAVQCIQKDYEGAIVEHIDVTDTHAILTLLVAPTHAVGTIIESLITSANATTPFLNFHYFVTNTNSPTKREVQEYLQSVRG